MQPQPQPQLVLSDSGAGRAAQIAWDQGEGAVLLYAHHGCRLHPPSGDGVELWVERGHAQRASELGGFSSP